MAHSHIKLAHDDGRYITESLRVEVEFEAHERGYGPDDTEQAIYFALTHTQHDTPEA